MAINSRQYAEHQPSEILVVIVGLGLAGLTAAIECHRKGHSVILLEKNNTVGQHSMKRGAFSSHLQSTDLVQTEMALASVRTQQELFDSGKALRGTCETSLATPRKWKYLPPPMSLCNPTQSIALDLGEGISYIEGL